MSAKHNFAAISRIYLSKKGDLHVIGPQCNDTKSRLMHYIFDEESKAFIVDNIQSPHKFIDAPEGDEYVENALIIPKNGTVFIIQLDKFIDVKNCGSFYIYYLHETPSCNWRYCGNN